MGIIFNFLYHKNTDSNPKKLKIDKEIGCKSNPTEPMTWSNIVRLYDRLKPRRTLWQPEREATTACKIAKG